MVAGRHQTTILGLVNYAGHPSYDAFARCLSKRLTMTVASNASDVRSEKGLLGCFIWLNSGSGAVLHNGRLFLGRTYTNDVMMHHRQ